ncbi:40S ribosomal protein S19 [Thalictrum thalictroides]|uniref:40S ribosomal protein S19 n=1 Tax=Thalictrum thalictroides TaxID=46969 RepID=A0A7J6VFF3_THATH|nr:40S ribosomal protein S19 [Thalictrum thalictroides]
MFLMEQYCYARKIYLRQGLGGFHKIYCRHKRNGSRRTHFCKNSGGIAHHILQQLENMKIVEIDPKGMQNDPMAIENIKIKDGTLEEIDCTEVIMNTLEPAWIGKFSIAYQFEIVQPSLV